MLTTDEAKNWINCGGTEASRPPSFEILCVVPFPSGFRVLTWSKPVVFSQFPFRGIRHPKRMASSTRRIIAYVLMESNGIVGLLESNAD